MIINKKKWTTWPVREKHGVKHDNYSSLKIAHQPAITWKRWKIEKL